MAAGDGLVAKLENNAAKCSGYRVGEKLFKVGLDPV